MFDIKKAQDEFRDDKNNAIAFIYENPSFSQGILNGITISIKDVFATKDAPTQASSKILQGFQPSYDSTIVTKLRNSGGAIIGKTHMDELALGGTGQSSSYGYIKNPIDTSYAIGGSSSGAAATISKNIGLAIGSDTGDSIRLPASFVGKVGFKPSFGAVSRFGLFASSSSFDTVGWLTHDVETSVKASQVLFGKDKKDMTSQYVCIEGVTKTKPKKIAFLKCQNDIKKYVAEKYNKTIEKFKKAGIYVSEVKIEKKFLNAIALTYKIISYSEALSNNSNLTGVHFGSRVEGHDWNETIKNTRTFGFGETVQKRFTLGAFYLEGKNQKDYFVRAQKIRRILVDKFAKILNNYDLFIYPSTEGIANKLGEKRTDKYMAWILTHANFSGNPSITLPWGKKNIMPFGLQLNAQLYRDKELLSYSLWVEDFLRKG